MSLRQRITEDMKTAMKAGEKTRLGTIRLILAAIKQREVDERITLDDGAVIAVMEKMQKQRKESISQFQAAARVDLVAVEEAEMQVIQGYFPQQLETAELDAAIAASVAEAGAKGPADMGRVMAILKPRIAGRADMGAASAAVKRLLAG